MHAFGSLQRVGIEATGTYGAGRLRYMQKAGIEVLEVTTPDKHDRRKRGNNDDLDAQNAAHAAFAGKRTSCLRRGRGGCRTVSNGVWLNLYEGSPAGLAKLPIPLTNFDQVASVLTASVAHDESTELPNSINDFVLEATRWVHPD